MNNWAGPKFMIAEGDTYMKYPDDETYPQLAVNYVKLDHVPAFSDGWTPLLHAMRAGDYFVSTGEVLFRNWGIHGSGTKQMYEADLEWTYPLDFVELVWGDSKTTGRNGHSNRRFAGLRAFPISNTLRRRRQEVGYGLAPGTQRETVALRSPCIFSNELWRI